MSGAAAGPPPVVAVVGATAVGKSELAVELARRIRAEIVNADSMQLYRGMDVGTAKLPPAERGGIAHHLLDVLDVTEEASVAQYQADARRVVDGLLTTGRAVVLVGGSGLYVTAVLDDLAFPGTDPALRAQLEAELADQGAPAMHARLAQVDPAAAAAILPGNGRRSVRAIEVVTLTGRPFTASLPVPTAHYDAVRVGLRRPREVLDRLVEARVARMWRDGLVDEVQGLVVRGLRQGRTASRALGYAQVLRMLDGDLSDEEAVAETVRTTRRFVRRQESWFGRDARTDWYDAGAPGLLELVVERVEQASRDSSRPR